MLNKKKFGAPDLFTLSRGLGKFFAASSTTMESLPLKELDFGLHRVSYRGGGNWDFPSQGPAFPPQEFEKNLLL